MAAGTFEPSHEREYYAIRNVAGLIDISPLFKYDVFGPEAHRLINKVVTRDLPTFATGQIKYSPWCDENGKIVDDGTFWRLSDDTYRITDADPNLRWLQDCGFGIKAEVVDRSHDLAALALQGPNSKRILNRVFSRDLINGIGYYQLGHGHFVTSAGASAEATVTRTGYTGDLGYEIWVDAQHAELLWDVLAEAGNDYGMLPIGMVALLDVSDNVTHYVQCHFLFHRVTFLL
jgi:aminomethyltransferase